MIPSKKQVNVSKQYFALPILVYMPLPHLTPRQRSHQLGKDGAASGLISKSTCSPLCFDLTAPIIALPYSQ